MEQKTANNALNWIEKEIQKHKKIEKILTPIFLILVFLWVVTLWSLLILDIMGKLR